MTYGRPFLQLLPAMFLTAMHYNHCPHALLTQGKPSERVLMIQGNQYRIIRQIKMKKDIVLSLNGAKFS